MTEQAARAVSTVISLIIFKYGLLIAVFPLGWHRRRPRRVPLPLPPIRIQSAPKRERGVLFIDLVPSLFHRTLSSPRLVNRRPAKDETRPPETQLADHLNCNAKTSFFYSRHYMINLSLNFYITHT